MRALLAAAAQSIPRSILGRSGRPDFIGFLMAISTWRVSLGGPIKRRTFLHFRRPQVWASRRPDFFSSQT
jgi:hypothetical protein